MKKYLIGLISSLLLFVSSMNAQEKKSKGPNIDAQVEKMTTDLSLNDAEKVSVKTFMEKQLAENKQFRKDNDTESSDFKPKMKELQLKQAAELKVILGEEKFQKFQKIRNEERKKPKDSE